MDTPTVIAIDTAALPWEERFNEKLGRALYRKDLITDPDTGMEVRLVRYPAGVINVRHTHPCAHGMYVLEGTLVTHAGRYGPGCFVWFPEGTVMEHGASADGRRDGAVHHEQAVRDPLRLGRTRKPARRVGRSTTEGPGADSPARPCTP